MYWFVGRILYQYSAGRLIGLKYVLFNLVSLLRIFFNNFRERGQVGQVGQGGQVGVLQLGSPLILDGRKCIEISDR